MNHPSEYPRICTRERGAAPQQHEQHPGPRPADLPPHQGDDARRTGESDPGHHENGPPGIEAAEGPGSGQCRETGEEGQIAEPRIGVAGLGYRPVVSAGGDPGVPLGVPFHEVAGKAAALDQPDDNHGHPLDEPQPDPGARRDQRLSGRAGGSHRGRARSRSDNGRARRAQTWQVTMSIRGHGATWLFHAVNISSGSWFPVRPDPSASTGPDPHAASFPTDPVIARRLDPVNTCHIGPGTVYGMSSHGCPQTGV